MILYYQVKTMLYSMCKYIYSKTSDSGPSEIGTQYIKPLNKGRFSRSQIIGLPIVVIHFEPPRRGQPLYKGQNTLIYIGPKVSFVRRFGCISMYMYSGTPSKGYLQIKTPRYKGHFSCPISILYHV